MRNDTLDPTNPFAMHRTEKASPDRKPLTNALKFLALIAVCFALVIVASNLSKKWYLHRLTSDMETLSVAEQQVRLAQISQLGAPGIKTLVVAMAGREPSVAKTAYDLLRQKQNDWTVLTQSQQLQRHAALVSAIKDVAIQIPDDRSGWGTALLQQTVQGTVNRKESRSRDLYRETNQVIEMLTLSNRAGPSILSDEVLDPQQPRRLAIQPEPLPVSALDSIDAWTVSPPPAESQTSEVQSLPQASDVSSPTVYRSTASRLQPVEDDELVILKEIADPIETSHEVNAIHSVTHLVDSPMQAYSDRSVIHWLSSPHQKLREQAQLELISRGFTETELSIGTQIASSDVQSRLEIVEKLSRDASVDPRPWLWMMTEDENRSVRLRVISILATMNDPEMGRRLQFLLNQESDPIVAARIRRILDLR